MRRVPPLVVGILAAAVAGCGQSNPELIPQANADTLQQTADKIQAACESKDRSAARAQIRLAKREIDALPRTVDAKLKQNLQDWLDQIQRRIPADCTAEATPTPTVTEAPTASATPTSTPTEAPTETATATAAPTETATAAPTETATAPPEPTTTPAPEVP